MHVTCIIDFFGFVNMNTKVKNIDFIIFCRGNSFDTVKMVNSECANLQYIHLNVSRIDNENI